MSETRGQLSLEGDHGLPFGPEGVACKVDGGILACDDTSEPKAKLTVSVMVRSRPSSLADGEKGATGDVLFKRASGADWVVASGTPSGSVVTADGYRQVGAVGLVCNAVYSKSGGLANRAKAAELVASICESVKGTSAGTAER